MTQPFLSIIIPTYNRYGLLQRHLKDLCHQTLSRDEFEIIVAHDGAKDAEYQKIRELARVMPYTCKTIATEKNSGPATARNRGASMAKGQVLVFLGDDCIPTPALLYHHYLAHNRGHVSPLAVQGLTLWAYQLAADDFHNFLFQGGLQANWNALRDGDKWKQDARGWFLTTNCSVTKDLFEAEGGFYPEFPSAAWEDICLATQLVKRGVQTVFVPNALNYHYHKQTLSGFVQRQIREGKSRLILCKVHWEVSGDMVNPQELRDYSDEKFNLIYRLAQEADRLTGDDSKELRYNRWATCLRMASIKGILEGIRERKGLWQALPDVHTSEITRHVCGAAGSFEQGDYMMAMQHSEWALAGNQDNHALLWVRGEIELALGHKAEAIASFQSAVERGPGNKLAKARLAELVV